MVYEEDKAEPWYEPREIYYDRDQMVFLLENLDILEGGYWSPNFLKTGYTEIARVQISPSNKAYFETPVQVAAEVNRRLKACGQDGEILRAHYTDGWPADRIARITKLSVDRIERRMPKTLNYISSGHWPRWVDHYKKKDGEKVLVRKAITYKEWIDHRRD